MKPKVKKVYEWFLVVEGRGPFPVDMLRYDSAVLCRRGVNESEGTSAHWASFGWLVVLATTDAGEAVAAVRGFDAKEKRT